MRIRTNSLFSLLAFIVPTGTVLVLYPILVRHIPAAELGIWFTASSLTGTFGLLDFGLAVATVKFISHDLARDARQRAAETLATSLLFYGALGALVCVVMCSISPLVVQLFRIDRFSFRTAVVVFQLSSLQLLFSFINSVFVAFFKGCGKFHYSTTLLCLTTLVMYTSSALAVKFAGAGIIQIAAIGVATQVLSMIVGVSMSLGLATRLRLPLRSARPTFRAIRRMFSFGSVMAIHSVCVSLFSQVQRLIVGALLGPIAVTTYTLAATVTSKPQAAVAALTEVLFPFASGSTDHSSLRRVYRYMQLVSGTLAIALLLPLGVFARDILRLWLRDDAIASQVAPLVPIFALGFFFVSLSAAPFHMLNGLGRPWFNVVFDIVNVVILACTLGVFYTTGITIAKMAWAFSIANIANSILYQISVEMVVWRSCGGSKGKDNRAGLLIYALSEDRVASPLNSAKL